jgi:hypothetical protein
MMTTSRLGGVVIMLRIGSRFVSLVLGAIGLTFVPAQALAQNWFNPFAPPAYNPTTMVFGGLTATPTSFFAYAGGAYGLGSDLWSDGYRVRALAGAGTYEHEITGAKNKDIPFFSGELMAGYSRGFGEARLSGFLGVHVESHNNKNPGADIDGTDIGIKGQAELWLPLSDKTHIVASGSLSSVHTSYYATARAMRRINKRFAIGPEAVAMGSRYYDQVRLGLAGEAWLGKTMLVISAGHGWNNSNGLMAEAEGVYGNAHFNIGF